MIGQNFQSPDVQQPVIAQRIRERKVLSGRKRFWGRLLSAKVWERLQEYIAV
jgi:hypothetical protein